MAKIREPVKKTSIEKKKKIIQKGFELMCDEGYYNVSTVDIAKYAGVSTGIIYQYFTDKRDIFVEGIKDYSDNILFPMINVFENEKIDYTIIDDIISKMLNKFIQTHTMSKKAHEQLMAMKHLDEEIAEIFKNKEIEMTEKIQTILSNNGLIVSKENIHIIYSLVDSFCHDVVYHKHKELDYELMKKSVVKAIVSLMQE